MSKIVRASFFKRDPLTCARELIGTELIWGECSGIVVTLIVRDVLTKYDVVQNPDDFRAISQA